MSAITWRDETPNLSGGRSADGDLAVTWKRTERSGWGWRVWASDASKPKVSDDADAPPTAEGIADDRDEGKVAAENALKDETP